MSRVAKMPVIVPAGVDVVFKEDHINVKGAWAPWRKLKTSW